MGDRRPIGFFDSGVGGLTVLREVMRRLPAESSIYLGDNARTMRVCEELLARGCYAQGIRHPSVPAGSARLRLRVLASP